MAKYLNQDQNVKKHIKVECGKINLDQFKKKLKLFKGYSTPEEEEEYDKLYDEIFYKSRINYEIDNENILTDWSECGYFVTSKGIPYMTFMQGGDWEYLVCIAVYWDGEKLRRYVPHWGNILNVDLKCAFGSKQSADDKEIREFAEKIDAPINDYGELEVYDDDLMSAYGKLHGIREDDSNATWDTDMEKLQAEIDENFYWKE